MTDAHVAIDEGSGKGTEGSTVCCIACIQDIKHNASKCHYCGSYQVRWRNWLPVIGTIVGILTFAASTVAVVLATAADFWEEAFGTDSVEIIAYTSRGLSVLNSGSRRLLIENVTEKADELNYSSVRPIQKVVSKNTVYVHLPSGEKASEKVHGFPIGNVSDEEWER